MHENAVENLETKPCALKYKIKLLVLTLKIKNARRNFFYY